MFHGSSFFLLSGVNTWLFIPVKLPCNVSYFPGLAPAARLHSATIHLPLFLHSSSVCAHFTPFIYSIESYLKEVCFTSESVARSDLSSIWMSQHNDFATIICSGYWFAAISKCKCWISRTWRHIPQNFSSVLNEALRLPITSLCEGDYCLSVLLNKFSLMGHNGSIHSYYLRRVQ